MKDEELIKQAKAALKEHKIPFGEFWEISRSPASFTTVWFWGKPKGCPNYSCQFDEEEGALLWCNP